MWITLRVACLRNHLIPLSGWRVDRQQSTTGHKDGGVLINSSISHFSPSRKNTSFHWYSVQVNPCHFSVTPSYWEFLTWIDSQICAQIRRHTMSWTIALAGHRAKGCARTVISSYCLARSPLAWPLNCCVFPENRASTGKDPVWGLMEWVNMVGFHRVRWMPPTPVMILWTHNFQLPFIAFRCRCNHSSNKCFNVRLS